MGLSQTNSLKMFNLVSNLVDELTGTNIDLIHDSENDYTAEHIITMCRDIISSEISVYETAYKFNKKISSSASYVHPEERAVGTRIELKRDPKTKIAVPRTIQSTCQYIPIRQSLRALFANDRFRYEYLKYNSEKHICIDGQYKNFCCGEIYKGNELFRSDLYTIQLQIFTDDFEPCSPLQSKAGVHKLTAVYFAVKNFPAKFQSKLNFIQLVCLCNSDDINKSTQADFNNIWQLVVEDMSKLEQEGICIGSRTIKAAICYPSFDNLGANISLGFAGSFSAECFCRFCECNSLECGRMTKEIESKNRTKENYASRLKIIESLEKVDYHRTCGVKRDCLLNELKYFHVTENISADILHDIYEGAMPFVLKHTIEYMIASKIARKDEIIRMIQFFDFGEMNGRNVPSILGLNKSNLGQNGAQMKCLFSNVPFIFARFNNIEKLTNVWKCMELLAAISQMVHSFELSLDNLNELNDKIITFLNTVQVVFGVKLIPKLHNLVHYIRIIKAMGPIVYMNTQRFESKHKVFKQIISRSPNFINTCKTLAIRHQQHISMTDFGLEDNISCGVKRLLTIDKCEESELEDICRHNEPVYETKFFCFNSYKYRANFFVIYFNKLYKIKRILLIDEIIHFYCSSYELLEFESFFNSYRISSLSQNELIKFDDLELKTPHERKIVECKEYIIADTIDIRKCSH